jgi:hypothetical protein
MSDIIPVYVVEGDFGNVGGGKVLGLFEDKAVAEENAKGCGSLDCGGDGIVRAGHALRAPDGVLYLLHSPTRFALNSMGFSTAKQTHQGQDHHPEWEPHWVEKVRNAHDILQAIRIIRQHTGMSLVDAKERAHAIRNQRKSPALALNAWSLTEEDADIIKDVGDPNSPRGKYTGTPTPLDPWEGTEEGDKMLARVLDPNDPIGKPLMPPEFANYEFNKTHKFVEEMRKSKDDAEAR